MTKFKPYAINRRAKFDYHIERIIYAGIVLLGHEVVSVRSNLVSLNGAFASFKNDEVWANNITISANKNSNIANYDELRARKLLLHKKEIEQLRISNRSGRYLVVMGIGSIGRYIKVQIGVGRSKKVHDKREVIKQRQAKIEASRAIKSKTRR